MKGEREVEVRFAVTQDCSNTYHVNRYEGVRTPTRVRLLNSDLHWHFRTFVPFTVWDSTAKDEQEAKQKFIDRLREAQRVALARAEGLGNSIRAAQEAFSK